MTREEFDAAMAAMRAANAEMRAKVQADLAQARHAVTIAKLEADALRIACDAPPMTGERERQVKRMAAEILDAARHPRPLSPAARALCNDIMKIATERRQRRER